MSSDQEPTGEDAAIFDALNVLNEEIAGELLQLVEDAGVAWDDARVLVVYWGPEDTSWTVPYRSGSDMSGVAPSELLKDLTEDFRNSFKELTGEELNRFRLTVTSAGRFFVEYSYDEPVDLDGGWYWIDEEADESE